MITVKQESKLLEKIKSMTELEFVTFFEELSDHIKKHNWDHVVKSRFGKEEELEEEIQSLESSLEESEKENRLLNSDIQCFVLKNATLLIKIEELISLVQ